MTITKEYVERLISIVQDIQAEVGKTSGVPLDIRCKIAHLAGFVSILKDFEPIDETKDKNNNRKRTR